MSRVSVVITCFDLGRFAPSAVESVRSQHHRDVEVILVDDGSTDPFTRQVLSRLSRQVDVFLRTTNQGPAAARNAGIRASRGGYIVCLDADDRLEPTALAEASAMLDTRPEIGFVTSWVREVGYEERIRRPSGCDLTDVLSSFGSVHVSSMFRRELWDAVNGFDEGLAHFEDDDFWLLLLERGIGGEIIEAPLLRKHVRPDGRRLQAIETGDDRVAMRALLAKHRGVVLQQALPMVLSRERTLQTLRARTKACLTRRGNGKTELATINGAIGDATSILHDLGRRTVDWGDLGRTTPLSATWGMDRGRCIDRYYIERFLETRAADIRGLVLEVGDSEYTRRYGGDRVVRSDVLDVDPTNPRANVVADLRRADTVPSGTYDCFILTQTLHLIDDVRAALSECARILKGGGVLLATLPVASRIAPEAGLDGDFWRFTEASALRLFAERFPLEEVEVYSFGNVLANVAFLYGLASHELSPSELDHRDPYFPLVITVRAQSPVLKGARRAPSVPSAHV